MKNTLILLSLLMLTKGSYAQYPDGTLLFSSKKGLIGNIAKRLTNGDQYTHIAIVYDNKIYESDWPRSKCTPISRYKYKRGSTTDIYTPKNKLTQKETQLLSKSVNSRLGEPYQLRNYINPKSPKTRGSWCSPWSGKALNDTGRYKLSRWQMHEPQRIFEHVKKDYQFLKRVRR